MAPCSWPWMSVTSGGGRGFLMGVGFCNGGGPLWIPGFVVVTLGDFEGHKISGAPSRYCREALKDSRTNPFMAP